MTEESLPGEIWAYGDDRTWIERKPTDTGLSGGTKYVRADLVDRTDHIGDVNKMVSENNDLAKDLAEYIPLPLAGIQRLIEAIEMAGYAVTALEISRCTITKGAR